MSTSIVLLVTMLSGALAQSRPAETAGWELAAGPPPLITVTAYSPAGIREPSLARESAEHEARVRLAQIASALARVSGVRGALQLTLAGVRITEVRCAEVCRVRAEVLLSNVRLARIPEDLERLVRRAFPGSLDAARAALQRQLADEAEPDQLKRHYATGPRPIRV